MFPYSLEIDDGVIGPPLCILQVLLVGTTCPTEGVMPLKKAARSPRLDTHLTTSSPPRSLELRANQLDHSHFCIELKGSPSYDQASASKSCRSSALCCSRWRTEVVTVRSSFQLQGLRLRGTLCLSCKLQAGKQAGRQAGKEAGKQAIKQASKRVVNNLQAGVWDWSVTSSKEVTSCHASTPNSKSPSLGDGGFYPA